MVHHLAQPNKNGAIIVRAYVDPNGKIRSRLNKKPDKPKTKQAVTKQTVKTKFVRPKHNTVKSVSEHLQFRIEDVLNAKSEFAVSDNTLTSFSNRHGYEFPTVKRAFNALIKAWANTKSIRTFAFNTPEGNKAFVIARYDDKRHIRVLNSL